MCKSQKRKHTIQFVATYWIWLITEIQTMYILSVVITRIVICSQYGRKLNVQMLRKSTKSLQLYSFKASI